MRRSDKKMIRAMTESAARQGHPLEVDFNFGTQASRARQRSSSQIQCNCRPDPADKMANKERK